MTQPNEKVAVSSEFLQKVVGFAEAANIMMKSAEDGKETLRAAAKDAVDALEKAGQLEEGQDKEKLVEGFVNKPEMAIKLAGSIAAETKKEGSAENEEQAPIGVAAEPEDKTKRAAVATKVAANVTQETQSDEVWNKGFGFSS